MACKVISCDSVPVFVVIDDDPVPEKKMEELRRQHKEQQRCTYGLTKEEIDKIYHCRWRIDAAPYFVNTRSKVWQ